MPWHNCCSCINFYGIFCFKIKMRERDDNSNLTVVSGITVVNVFRSSCAWYWQKGTNEALPKNSTSANLAGIEARKVPWHFGDRLESAIFVSALRRVGVLLVRFQPIRCRAQCWVDLIFQFVKIWLLSQSNCKLKPFKITRLFVAL